MYFLWSTIVVYERVWWSPSWTRGFSPVISVFSTVQFPILFTLTSVPTLGDISGVSTRDVNNCWTIVFLSFVIGLYIYIMYQNKSNLLTYKLQKRFVDRACDWTLWPVGECTITLLGKPMTMELKNVVITQRIDLTVQNVTQILYNYNSNTKCTLLWFLYT